MQVAAADPKWIKLYQVLLTPSRRRRRFTGRRWPTPGGKPALVIQKIRPRGSRQL